MKKNTRKFKKLMKQHKIMLKQFRESRCCSECGSKKKLTLHHIIPKSLKGKSTKENLIVLCRNCHNKEHSLKPDSKRWTNDEIDLIVLLRKQGYTFDEISEMLDRSISSCTSMIHNIKLGVDNLSRELRKK